MSFNQSNKDYFHIKYHPAPVRKILTEIKDLSELMVDLAYSSVLFDDLDLAEEVVELEDEVDRLMPLLIMNAALAVRDKEDAESIYPIIKTASAIDRISNEAAGIARVVLRKIGVDPLISEALSYADERLVRTSISSDSILRQKKLGEVGLETNIGVIIRAVRRNGELYLDIDDEFVLEENDVIVAKGTDTGIVELDMLARGGLKMIPKPKVL
jgi:uncharacterized protein with PhoU and TrkA domain